MFTEELLNRGNEVELEIEGNIIKTAKLIAKGQKKQFQSSNMGELIKVLTMPKVEIGIVEKRSVAQYETKEYACRTWFSVNDINDLKVEELIKIQEKCQEVVNKQIKEDGLKPLQKETPKTEKSAIDKAFGT